MREYYRIKYAGTARHEHWYCLDGEQIRFGTCILNDSGARCVAAMAGSADEVRLGRYSKRITPSRLPKYVENRFEDIKSRM